MEWAAGNVIVGSAEAEGAATIRGDFVDTGLPIAGESAPPVSEFALMELVAVLAVASFDLLAAKRRRSLVDGLSRTVDRRHVR
ncbi:hypothetical protein [Pimelobacter sp. 30-1]|uniref:hypothetical protein n=1 Tax=Pimelobacter sp. 30-1 TaxID=2004991 RepID=UPI001C040AFF|nr:hypothetical protein [Pimelobacter sp. 30-1]MBU2696215.1 hypothetical protein [Pimelobacter sp. 30-1]